MAAHTRSQAEARLRGAESDMVVIRTGHGEYDIGFANTVWGSDMLAAWPESMYLVPRGTDRGSIRKLLGFKN